MTTKKGLIVLIVALIFGVETFAQEDKKERVGQVSFFYPIGTSGVHSLGYSNRFSFNIIGGINGGVNGFELSSVLNINNGDVDGVQVAGVSNLTLGNSSGAIISGVLNISESHKGFQLSTVNVAYGEMTGMQTGVVNLTKEVKGAQLSTINLTSGEVDGAQIGVVNVAKEVKGVQLSTVNLAAKEMDGAQIGVVNVAGKSKGFQLGVINIANGADSILPVGLVNIVKDGYYGFELSTNELLLSSFSFKMGVEKFHTMFRVGFGSFNDNLLFSKGVGLGTIIPVKDDHKVNVEVICDQIIYDKNWDDNLNLLNQLNINYQYQITDCLAVKAGPSIKTYVTNQKVNNEFDTIDVPYTIFEDTGKKVKTSVWIGFNAGIVLSL